MITKSVVPYALLFELAKLGREFGRESFRRRHLRLLTAAQDSGFVDVDAGLKELVLDGHLSVVTTRGGAVAGWRFTAPTVATLVFEHAWAHDDDVPSWLIDAVEHHKEMRAASTEPTTFTSYRGSES